MFTRRRGPWKVQRTCFGTTQGNGNWEMKCLQNYAVTMNIKSHKFLSNNKRSIISSKELDDFRDQLRTLLLSVTVLLWDTSFSDAFKSCSNGKKLEKWEHFFFSKELSPSFLKAPVQVLSHLNQDVEVTGNKWLILLVWTLAPKHGHSLCNSFLHLQNGVIEKWGV